MHAASPLLLPQPRHYHPLPGALLLDAATTIQLAPQAGPATLTTARQCQHALRDALGLPFTIVKSAHQENTGNALHLRLISGHPSLPDIAQAYRLTVTEDGIWLEARDEAGLFYGAQTLIQLVRVHGRRLPGCAIDDWPALPQRGIMLDVSRGRVPRRATLLHLAATLAHYKINQLQLYIEHTFHFPSHPRIGHNCGALTSDDILALDAVCRAHHIELVPNLQSTGHLRHLLSLPEYEHLAESDWRWSLTPGEATYRLLDQLYGDLLPSFSSPRFNIDSDEAWDFARGRTRAERQDGNVGRLYLDHLLRLRELAARHGRQIMVWADVLHHHPELLPDIPHDVILLDWNYEAQPGYPTLQTLARAGRPFYVCPGTSTWNTIFPRLDNALGNIRTYVREGIAAGACGMLLTDWGDYGHYQPLSHSWYGYLFGAEMAWSGGATSTDAFDAAFGVLFCNDASGQVVAALRRMGRAVEQPGLARSNGSESVYALYQDPLAGRLNRLLPEATLEELIQAGAAALPALARLSDPTLRTELAFAARQMIYAGSKVRLGQQIGVALRELAGETPTPAGVARLDALIAALQRLRDQLPPMRQEFEQLWLAQSRRSEIDVNLRRYDALLTRFDAALTWLRQQRDAYARGAAIDAALASYDAGHDRLFWEQGYDDLQRLAAIIGADALPPEVRLWLDLPPLPATAADAEGGSGGSGGGEQ